MRTALRALLAPALLLAGAAAAPAGEMESLESGDTLTGTIEAGVLEVVPVDAAEGTLLDVDLRMPAGSGADFDLLNPDRTLHEGAEDLVVKDSKGASAKAKKIVLEQSGTHFLRLRPAAPGTYSLKIKLKPLTKGSWEGFVAGDPPTLFTFGGVPGALLTAKLSAAKKSTLAPRISFLRGPSGEDVPLDGATHKATTKYDQYSNVSLPDLGTYTLAISTQTSTLGDYGVLSLKLKFPKVKAEKVEDDDLLVDPFVDSVDPAQGFDNLPYASIAVTGDFFTPGAAVRIEGEGGTVAASATTRYNDQILGFDIDLAGAAAGSYDLVVTVPSGGEGRIPGGFAVRPTPIPTGITPTLGFDNGSHPFTVTGSRFQAGMAVAVRPSGGGSTVGGIVGAVTDTSASVSLPLLNAPLGTFDVIVTNPDGGTRTLPAALTVDAGPRISGMTPLLGHDNDAARSVAVTGVAFETGLVAALWKDGQADVPGVVTNLTSTSFTATFDLRSKESGIWTLRAANTDGGTVNSSFPFVVARAPRVASLSLTRGFQGETAAGVVVTGSDMVPTAQANLEQAGIPTVLGTGETVGGGGTTLTMDLSFVGAPVGAQDLRVTNPDGGSEVLPGAMAILGRRSAASGVTVAGRPAVGYNPEDGEYLVAYTVESAGQKDVRAQRFSATTGAPLGSVIEITSLSGDASSTESQSDPAVSYSAADDVWLVVYAWADPEAESNPVGIRSQFVNRNGTLNSTQESALVLFNGSAGTVGRPRVAWNPERTEWLVVWAWDRSSAPDIYHAVVEVQDFGGYISAGIVSSGKLIETTHTASTPGGSATIPDIDDQPDVAYSSGTDEYLVAYELDVVEVGSGGGDIPPDSGKDVRARFFDDDFTAGPVARGSVTNLGDVNAKDETNPSLAYDPASNRFLVAWEYGGAAGNRDVRGYLVDATSRARVGSSVTTLEQTSSEDAASPAVSFDPAPSTGGWRVAHAVGAGASGSSRIALARLPVTTGSSGLGTPAWKDIVPAATGASYTEPCLLFRGTGSEFLAGWRTAGTGLDPLEVLLSR
ncbi:MAG: hypothetical protein HUU06_05810 [Planctomycetaceae bacterium]|nr:hypothetical protein [Planctomycetaceae bacterium]